MSIVATVAHLSYCGALVFVFSADLSVFAVRLTPGARMTVMQLCVWQSCSGAVAVVCIGASPCTE